MIKKKLVILLKKSCKIKFLLYFMQGLRDTHANSPYSGLSSAWVQRLLWAKVAKS